jgi:hypothetical protein
MRLTGNPTPSTAALDYDSSLIGALELSSKKWVFAVQLPGHVMQLSSPPVDRRARRSNTGMIDVEMLRRTLMAPDRNPDLKHLKADTVGCSAIQSYADFKVKVKSSVHSLQRNTKKIRSFFTKDTSDTPPECLIMN